MDTAATRAIYTAAADHFDELPFWHHFGRRTIERLGLSPGARVLDLCCGTGASAIPAAETVGPAGRVIGVDLTEPLVRRAQARAAARGLANARFICADVASLRDRPAAFDAVISVFGLFFIDDMAGLLARAWRWVGRGGQLAITTWGRDVLAPGEALFWDLILAEEPGTDRPNHARRLDSADKIAGVFAAAGLPVPEIAADRWEMPLASPAAFWPVVLGTSNRGAYDALAPSQQARVRAALLDALDARGITSAGMDVWYARAARTGA